MNSTSIWQNCLAGAYLCRLGSAEFELGQGRVAGKLVCKLCRLLGQIGGDFRDEARIRYDVDNPTRDKRGTAAICHQKAKNSSASTSEKRS
jgi:hypothetical protein